MSRLPRLSIIRFSLLTLVLSVPLLGVITHQGVLLTTTGVLFAVRSMVVGLLYVYSPEVFPTVVRSSCMGVCAASHRAASIVAPVVFASIYDSSFLVSAIVFACIYFVALCAAMLLRVETRGKALADQL